ncbi:MAG TPA: hypothetical protein VMJ11_29890 [Paraburkholderia sp.]|uniref:hypothetical protein n=1 Tax=Paraburkholderia sp. TaxID=1926495 RepID=UPI002CBF4094|nr:hypothetical protein [Paraburkholderia sp.]HTR10792.1 hypothetical protein [Paraburkholderia sp.]
MTYSFALKVFAVMLALICIGLMSFVAYYRHAPQAPAPGPNFAADFVPEHMPRWPDTTVRVGMLTLLVSFVVLSVACLRIADI